MSPRVACGGCVEATSLEVGLRGTFEARTFRLVGSAHVVSRAGGHWQEWRAAIDGGGEAWLAEAHGAFYWMHEGALASWKSATPGTRFAADFVVVERGEATRVRTTGKVDVSAGQTYRYVDLSGPGGAFASVDYGDDAARTFVGRRVTLAELGLTPRSGTRSFLRVEGHGFAASVAPGATVTLDSVAFTSLGALARSSHGHRWRWQENLLWNPTAGIRWLVLSEGHWSVATPIDAGDVREDGSHRVYGKRSFRQLDEAVARVDAAVGQFPWEVRVGDQAATTDWVQRRSPIARENRAPKMLSRETTPDEIAWSVVTKLDPKQAARALVISLPRLARTRRRQRRNREA